MTHGHDDDDDASNEEKNVYINDYGNDAINVYSFKLNKRFDGRWSHIQNVMFSLWESIPIAGKCNKVLTHFNHHIRVRNIHDDG